MSSHETLTELVEVLIDKTRDKRLMWEPVGEADTYATVIDGSYTLRVYRDDNEVCLVLREMHSPEAITLSRTTRLTTSGWSCCTAWCARTPCATTRKSRRW